jgi:hypothetical protein
MSLHNLNDSEIVWVGGWVWVGGCGCVRAWVSRQKRKDSKEGSRVSGMVSVVMWCCLQVCGSFVTATGTKEKSLTVASMATVCATYCFSKTTFLYILYDPLQFGCKARSK